MITRELPAFSLFDERARPRVRPHIVGENVRVFSRNAKHRPTLSSDRLTPDWLVCEWRGLLLRVEG
jgi:hypothetical protein